jgi:hypothetical protein
LSEQKAAYGHAEPQWLLRASRMQVHLRLGYGSFHEYAERLFGYSPRETAERLRVAEALAELPEMASALRANALPWTAVRELARVATPATEPQWIQAAKGCTVREIGKMGSGRQPGDGPSDPAHESARTLVVRFEVRAETLASLREAKAALIRRMGQRLTDDELILLLSIQPPRASQTIPPAVRRQVLRRDGGKCLVPGCRRPFPRSKTLATKKPKSAPRSTGPRPTWVQTRASPNCSGWRCRGCRCRDRDMQLAARRA